MTTVSSLSAVAEWNASRGMDLYRQAQRVKNNADHAEMIRCFARHIHTADNLRRQIFLLEHRSKHGR